MSQRLQVPHVEQALEAVRGHHTHRLGGVATPDELQIGAMELLLTVEFIHVVYDRTCIIRSAWDKDL